jgi:hypothetical protein
MVSTGFARKRLAKKQLKRCLHPVQDMPTRPAQNGALQLPTAHLVCFLLCCQLLLAGLQLILRSPFNVLPAENAG